MSLPLPVPTPARFVAGQFRKALIALLLPATLGAQRTEASDSSGPRSVRRAMLDLVTVVDSTRARTAYRIGRTSSATRTSTLLRDVPQSVTVITRALMADQGMVGMADVVRYVPGITMAQGEGHRDAPVIRGQASTADFFIDGIRDDAQYYRDIYNAERIEALKGPNAMVFGRGGGGGVINRVSKDAQWQAIRMMSVSAGRFKQRRTTLDIGQALWPSLAARLNALYDNSANFRDRSGAERIGINPTISVLRGATLLRLGYEYYNDRRVVDRGIPSFAGAPSRAPIAAFFGDPDASRSRLTAQSLAATLDRQLWRGNATVSAIQLRNRTRAVTYNKFYQNIYPGATNSALTSVSLQGYNSATDRTNLFNQTDVTAVITRGTMRHTLLVGTEFAIQRTDNLRNTAYFGATGSTTTSLSVPFERPTVQAPVTFRASSSDADGRTTLATRALYAQDQIDIDSHVQAVLGLRLDDLALDYVNRRNNQRLRRTDRLVSPRAGLVIKPVLPLSIYGSLAVSFLPGSGDQFGALTVTTQTLKPEQFTNREVGLKWDVTPALALTAAAYRLDRTNTTAPDPANPAVVAQTGAQRTTGWELGATGAMTSRWRIAGGYARQDARIVSQTSAASAGARVPLVPEQTLSLWNHYQLSTRFGASIGTVYQASMFAAIDNTVTLPTFTRLDGALFATVAKGLRAQVNIENLFNARYYATAHSNNNIMPGSPRLVRLTFNVAP